eukprot:scaffold157943_cov28-Tisochrysis_lutea.AAC.3
MAAALVSAVAIAAGLIKSADVWTLRIDVAETGCDTAPDRVCLRLGGLCLHTLPELLSVRLLWLLMCPEMRAAEATLLPDCESSASCANDRLRVRAGLRGVTIVTSCSSKSASRRIAGTIL